MSDDGIDFQPAASADGIDFQPLAPEKSLSGFGKNLVSDVEGNVKGLGDLAAGLVEHPIDTISGIPAGLINEGKRVGLGEMLTGHPVNAIEKFGNAAYDKPLTTAMDVAPVVGAAGKALGIGGAAAEGAEAAEIGAEAAPAAEAVPKGLPVIEPGAKAGAPHALFSYNDEFGPEGAPRSLYNVYGDPEHPAIKSVGHGSSVTKDILDKAGIPVTGREPRSVGKFEPIETPTPEPSGAPKNSPPPQSPPDAAFTDNIAQKAKEVGNYINNRVENITKKPGTASDIADYVQEKSQMMSGQQMGFTPLQNRQLGSTPTEQLNNMRAIGQYGMDSGIVSPAGGLRHMVETNKALLDKAGDTLGALRKEADKLRDPKVMPIDVLQEIRKQMDPVFARGTRSGEAGAYKTALETVEDHPATFEGMAKAATELNKAANGAAKLNQPHGAFTDVANAISRIENNRIRELLGPQKAAEYDQALKEFGINKKIESALKRKVGGETKRMGPGSLTSNLTQKALDEVGYRVGAKAANKFATAIKGNPSLVKDLPSIFKEFGNHIDETVGEVSGMSKGGVVPDDVRQYVSKAC